MQRALFSLSLLSESGANGNEAAPVEGTAGVPANAQEASQPATRQVGRGRKWQR